MNRGIGTALAAVALIAVGACTGWDATTDEQSYQIDQPITALVVNARAAHVTIETSRDRVTVTETHRYGGVRPSTAHRVDGQTLRLTETGCRDDNHARCEVEYRIRVPSATTADITTAAGKVTVHGLAGNVTVRTQAGAVEGRRLAADQVSVTTEAGAASLEFAQVPSLIQATTDVGAVEVRVPGESTYAISALSPVGAAHVSVLRDDASPHRIEVQTQVGTVHIEPT